MLLVFFWGGGEVLRLVLLNLEHFLTNIIAENLKNWTSQQFFAVLLMCVSSSSNGAWQPLTKELLLI
jgi:hypothetical protein